jgi:hypothetical protein
MVQKKNSAWEEIATNFNACAETGSRNSKQLRVLYENIKRETKKTVAEQHVRVESLQSRKNNNKLTVFV